MIYENQNQFHLQNEKISYILRIMPDGKLHALWFGGCIAHREDFSHLASHKLRMHGMEPYPSDAVWWEYPAFGMGDFRTPAFELWQSDGAHVTDLCYDSHEIFRGKRPLAGLPSTYTERLEEAETLELTFCDGKLLVTLIVSYTIFKDYPAVARSVRFINNGEEPVTLGRVMSMSADMRGEYDLITLSGAWGRECYVNRRPLVCGTQGVYSMRGASSAQHNPFVALASKGADEEQGDVYGFSLVYSGNFLAQADVDSYGTVRVSMGIHPQNFEWVLEPGESFTSPETS